VLALRCQSAASNTQPDKIGLDRCGCACCSIAFWRGEYCPLHVSLAMSPPANQLRSSTILRTFRCCPQCPLQVDSELSDYYNVSSTPFVWIECQSRMRDWLLTLPIQSALRNRRAMCGI